MLLAGLSTCKPNVLRLPRSGQVAALLVAWLAATGWSQPRPAGEHEAAGSFSSGQRIFEARCVACHSIESHRVGPALGAIFGQRAGKSPDYVYSDALRRATHRWDREKLLAWLADPQALVPGQAMAYRVEQETDRLDLVAYLASLTVKP